jgi:hypothetical protein
MEIKLAVDECHGGENCLLEAMQMAKVGDSTASGAAKYRYTLMMVFPIGAW